MKFDTELELKRKKQTSVLNNLNMSAGRKFGFEPEKF
jgi:hypothetical protein